MVVVGLFLEKMASCHMRSKTKKMVYIISFNGREFLLQKVMHRFLLGVEAENDMFIYQVSLL